MDETQTYSATWAPREASRVDADRDSAPHATHPAETPYDMKLSMARRMQACQVPDDVIEDLVGIVLRPEHRARHAE